MAPKKKQRSERHGRLRRGVQNAFLTAAFLTAVAGMAVGAAAQSKGLLGGLYPLGETTPVPRLPDEPVPYIIPPERPELLVEAGCKFLGRGNLPQGVKLPTGAVLTPCLWVFGTWRTAMQTYESVGPAGRNTELVTRLDLFANLNLTTTDKCIIGVAPFDKNRFTNFTRYSWESNQGEEGGRSEAGVFLRTAFCDGDIGSMFPIFDPKGTTLLDFGYSFGRQRIHFQEGIMINDVLDAVGIVRNTLHAPGISNIRITGVYAWGSIDRGGPGNRQRLNRPGGLYGLFLQADDPTTTWGLDFIALDDDDDDTTGGDSLNVGLSATQRAWTPWSRLASFNTTYRVNASFARDTDTALAADGVLVSAEISWTPHNSDDVVYINPFYGFDRFTQVSREPIFGGPLAPLGISFASPSLGNHLSELNSFNTQAAGIAMGYQAFWDNHRRNLVIEIAGLKDNTRNLFKDDGNGTDAVALSVQLQQAYGQRVQFQLDAFVAYLEGRDHGSGARAEILVQF
ncbi:MAG: hypothetical protein VCD66_04815 [Alphaproteobacteria bacterium]